MNENWLTQLAPERAPPPPAWWPPAVGWWLLAALCLGLIGASVLWWHRSGIAQRRRVRRSALLELELVRALREADRARALQRLMRRFAMTAYGADRVSSLSGDAWLRFLEAHGGDAFGGTNGRIFLSDAFGAAPISAAQPDWISAAEAFIRHAPPKVRA